MACGHCRRRKIRCILPIPPDPQGRCANCIRLKKECIFSPVEHLGDAQSSKEDSDTLQSPSSSASQTPIITGRSAQAPASLLKDPDDDAALDPNEAFTIGSARQSLSLDTLAAPVRYDYQTSIDQRVWAASPPAGGQIHSPYWHSAQTTPLQSQFPSMDAVPRESQAYGFYPQDANVGQIAPWQTADGSIATSNYAATQTQPQSQYNEYIGYVPPDASVGSPQSQLSSPSALYTIGNVAGYQHPSAMMSAGNVLPSNDAFHTTHQHDTGFQYPPETDEVHQHHQWYPNAAGVDEHGAAGNAPASTIASSQPPEHFASRPG